MTTINGKKLTPFSIYRLSRQLGLGRWESIKLAADLLRMPKPRKPLTRAD